MPSVTLNSWTTLSVPVAQTAFQRGQGLKAIASEIHAAYLQQPEWHLEF